ncbi:MAG: uroporphyrinogen-III synthase [Bacteroides sp.]|nr:MAG: uroporphyrinogen-III synthase [Bacteroides sp.]
MNHKIRNILIGHEYPKNSKNPYFNISNKYNIKIDFKPFIKLEAINIDLHKNNFTLYKFTAVIFASKISIDYFFQYCKKINYNVNIDTKYFCKTESIALYLKKYIKYRKRKIFFNKELVYNFENLIAKYSNELYLYPCSNTCNDIMLNNIINYGCQIKKVIMYKNLKMDLSYIKKNEYDIVAVFTPKSVIALLESFPDIGKTKIKIASFGNKTHNTVINAGLTIDIKAPTNLLPSMTMAIDYYIRNIC